MKEDKVLPYIEQRADQILAVEGQMRELKDEDFPARTQAFKEQLENGKTLDDILVEAFALAREAARGAPPGTEKGADAEERRAVGGASFITGERRVAC